MQLRELDEVHDELLQQGVAIHAVTAETGGSNAVKARLAERDSAVKYTVHSDPEFKLLLPRTDAAPGSDEAHSFFVKREIEASQYGGTYEDYVLVQPALVVVDKSGAIQQKWSWNSEPLVHVEPKEEMTFVGSMGGAVLVSIRPETADLGPSIREGRDVKLKGKGMLQIIAEMPKVKSPKEFWGTLVRATKSMVAFITA
mmetsp:Transcript_15148/g.32606  ORF Transcript_15148/g.32606 Transcript_15148/m.32606 type:complete len:199 (-) Transcript_15148:187-783(-)